MFQGDPLDVNELKTPKDLALARQLLKNGDARIEYLVENKAKKKTVAVYSAKLPPAEYQSILAGLRANAAKQRLLLTDLLEDRASYPKKQADLEKEGVAGEAAGRSLPQAASGQAIEKQAPAPAKR